MPVKEYTPEQLRQIVAGAPPHATNPTPAQTAPEDDRNDWQKAFDELATPPSFDIHHPFSSGAQDFGAGVIGLMAPLFHPEQTGKTALGLLGAGFGAPNQFTQEAEEGLVSPFIRREGEKGGDYAARLGGAGIAALPSLAAPELAEDLPAEGSALIAKIPTRAKAGKIFEHVMSKAENEPVWMQHSGPELVRARELANAGGGRPSVFRALDRRVGNVNASPMTYREARDFASNLSRQSARDTGPFSSVSPTQMRQMGKLSKTFNQDVGEAASRAGVGDEYSRAMTDYARAMRLRNGLIKAGKWAVPAVVGGGLAAKLAHSILPQQ